LRKDEIRNWIKSATALTVLATVVGIPFSLVLNREVNPISYPSGWQLILASFKAGVVEEIVYRMFTVSVFVWLGSLFKHEPDGRPTQTVYWAAIVLSGLIFGWAHVDARLTVPGVPVWGLPGVMVLSSLLGILFGWMFWKYGIEWAMLAHFFYDAMVSAVVIPVYVLSENVLAWGGLTLILVLSGIICWRYLTTKLVDQNRIDSGEQ
jgi:membrane protease YdiL (CAAX protease family)